MFSDGGMLIIFCVIIVIVIGYSTIKNNKNIKKYKEMRLRESWGKYSEQEYSSEGMESIARYADRICGDRFFVDDITWNDLNMEDLFKAINQTVSSCGEDYLYAMLRIPEYDDSVLTKRNRLMHFFGEHEKERIQVQHVLLEIGKFKDNSIVDYINRMNQVEKKSIVLYVICAVLSLCSIASLFIVPLIGMFFFIGMTFVSIYIHHTQSRKMEPYFRSFSCILRLLNASKKMEKIEAAELRVYRKRIAESAAPLMKLRKRVRLFTNSAAYDDWITILLSYINSYFMLDFIVFYLSVDLCAEHQEQLEALIENFGILDSAIAVASYRAALPYYCEPDLYKSEKSKLEVKDIYHPMIKDPIANSITAEGGVLLTGSNASGKSTFLKSVAVNAIFAQTIYTCPAHQYRAPYMKVMTSMSLRDDIANNESYYIVEIKSIRRIMEEGKKGVPMLCMVDEVLRGTNTIERIAASSSILYSLNQDKILAFAATHDIELTHILEECYTNYHFEEEIIGKDVVFSYLLKDGRAYTRNAIALLNMMGYDKTIIDASNRSAKEFEKTGIWSKLDVKSEKRR